jgi:hypothetical protein
MFENIFSDVGIQEVLASNQGIDGTERLSGNKDFITEHFRSYAGQG